MILAFSIAFGAVMFDMQDYRVRVVKELTEGTNFADIIAYTDNTTISLADALIENETDDYVDKYESRMMLPVQFKINKEPYEGYLIGIDLSRNERINALIDEKKNEIEDYEFALNLEFASEFNVEIGDKIEISKGSIEETVKVKHLGYNFEFQFFPIYENIAFPSMKPYPVLYIDNNFLNSSFLSYLNTSSLCVNEFLFKLKDGVDESEAQDKIEKAFGPYLGESIDQYNFPYIKGMREDEESDRQLFLVLTIILLLSAIITLVLMMYKLVEEDLKSVSVFQGLGANKREILLSYLCFNVLLVIFASILGLMLSSVLQIPVNNVMLDALGCPVEQTLRFSYLNAIGIALFLLIVSITATFFIVKKIFTLNPQQTLKYETKFLTKPNLIEKIYSKIRVNPHPFAKYNLRRIFSRKLHFASLLIALSVSGSLLVFSYAFTDSLEYSKEVKVNTIESWDCVANTNQYENKSIEIILDSINEIDTFETGIVDVAKFSKNRDDSFKDTIRIMAYEEDSELHLLKEESGRLMEKDTEVMISKDLVETYHLKVGDKVFLKAVNLNKIFEVKIVGIVNDLSSNTVYLSIPEAQKIIDKPNRINTIYFTANGDVDKASEAVESLPQIELVVKLETIENDFDYLVQVFASMMMIFGLIFLAFGLILLLVIFKSIVDYRIEDYSNMKGVGLLNTEIRRTLFFELLMYFFFSVTFGLILGTLLMGFVVEMYSYELPGYLYYVSPMSYAYCVLSLSIILIISYIYNYARIRHVNIADVMRAKTFG